jgi:hypothetical protein
MNIFYIVLGVALFIYIVCVVVKGTFDIYESIFWIIGTVIILILSIFPNLIIWLAGLIGIEYAPSLLFLLVAVFLLFVNFRNTQKIVKQKERILSLAQDVAILKEEVRNINNK